MPLRRHLYIALLFLSACLPLSPTGEGQAVSTPAASISRTPTGPAVVEEVLEQAPTVIPAVLQVSPTPASPAAGTVIVPAAGLSIFSVCSPLALHSIQELPEIISDPYHPPPPGREERHQGVDFSYYQHKDRASILGEGVQAVLAGKVAASLVEKMPYGNVVIVETPASKLPVDLAEILDIEEGESLYLLYAHMHEPPLVELGDEVTACQELGAVGKSGNAGIAHLHLEVRVGLSGQVIEGMAYYDTKASLEEAQEYLRWRISGDFNHRNPMHLLLGEAGQPAVSGP
jgi:murein DD-endopeptidase MepM/ murein hydrolase activator NlpD